MVPVLIGLLLGAGCAFQRRTVTSSDVEAGDRRATAEAGHDHDECLTESEALEEARDDAEWTAGRTCGRGKRAAIVERVEESGTRSMGSSCYNYIGVGGAARCLCVLIRSNSAVSPTCQCSPGVRGPASPPSDRSSKGKTGRRHRACVLLF